jgi:putative inorganic carbon (HCO3(-)) transporter
MTRGTVALRAVAAILLLYLAASPGFRTFGLYHWHDSQRCLQLIALSVVCVAMLVSSGLRIAAIEMARRIFPGRVAWLAAAAGCMGLLSVAVSASPRFAALEFALLGALCLAGIGVAAMRLREGCRADPFLLSGIVLTAAVLVLPFLVAWLAAMTSGVGLRPALLYQSGFSNVRFLGQFHTLALPLLGCALLLPGLRRGHRWLLFALLAVTWVMAIGTATRATWLAWTVGALVVLPFAGRTLLPLLKVQAAAVAAALPLSWLMLELLPRFAVGGMQNASGLASVMGRFSDPLALSMRDILWVRALEIIELHPWLGVGPMMLALDHNRVAAHPHNALLQLAAEWGMPATILLVAVGAALGWRLLAALRGICKAAAALPTAARPGEVDRLDGPAGTAAPVGLASPGFPLQPVLACALACSMAGAVVHSLVDGLLVMPHAQVACALVGGWLVGLLLDMAPASGTGTGSATIAPARATAHWWAHAALAGMALFAVVAFARGALPEAFDLDAREHAYFDKYLGDEPRKPRLWSQGWLFEDVPADLVLDRRPAPR